MIRVHRIPFSTNVERVALAAGHKGVEIEWVDHAAADRTAVIDLSGQSLVPVAEFDGEVVRGSMRIVERIERDHPEPSLLPEDPAELARTRIFVAFFDRVWKGPPNALDAPEPPPDADALAARLRTWSGWFEDLLAEDPYLGGDRLGLADVCAFPVPQVRASWIPAPTTRRPFHAVLASTSKRLLIRSSPPGSSAEFDSEVSAGRCGSSSGSSATTPGHRCSRRIQPSSPARSIFVAFFDRVWKGPPNALDTPEPPPDADALAARLRTWSGWFEDLLAEDPYLGGDRLGLADVCAFPFLKYARHGSGPGRPGDLSCGAERAPRSGS